VNVNQLFRSNTEAAYVLKSSIAKMVGKKSNDYFGYDQRRKSLIKVI